MAKIDVFRHVTLFSHLDENTLELIAGAARQKMFERDQVIVWEKDAADIFFIIESGEVKVTKMSDDGREITLSYLREGDFFGEMALLIDQPRTATVTTTKPTCVLKIYRKDFLDILKKNAETSVNLLRKLCQRLTEANLLIENLVHIDVCGRLAGYLRKMAREDGSKRPDGAIEFRRPTQQEIAHSIGTSRETVSRLLKELERQGLIRTEGKNIFLKKSDVEDYD